MKVFFITKKKIKLSLLAGFLAVTFGAVWGVGALIASAKDRMLPVYSVETSEKKIALTFDVAWEASDLEAILSVLKENKAKGTFFTTGDWVDRHPEELKTILSAGHEVGNHSDRHPHVAEIDLESLQKDTAACGEKLKTATGQTPVLYRAPYGEYDNEMLTALKEMGYTVVQWDVDSRDWQTSATVDSIVKNVTEHVGPGSITLFHVDAKPRCTVEALTAILPSLKEQGYSFVTAGELLPKGDYVIDRTGRAKQS